MFYDSTFDPKLILGQIVVMQCLFYLNLGGILIMLDTMVGNNISMRQILGPLRMETLADWLTIFCFVLNAVVAAGCLLIVVERAKKCLDFAATVHLFHFLFCLFFGGMPNIAWFIWNIVFMVIMAVLGEYICMKRELKEIPMRGVASFGTSMSNLNNSGHEPSPLPEEIPAQSVRRSNRAVQV